MTDVPAFQAYERYHDPDERSNKSTGSVSFVSQDTFTTFAADSQNLSSVWGKRSIFPRLSCWNITWPQQFVRSRTFKRLSIALIVINCIIAGIATSDWVTESYHTQYYFDMIKNIFVYIMSVELFTQFLANGVSLFANGWLVFDFVFIGLAWMMPNLLVVRTFRVVRTLRLASWVKDLKELVIALLLVIPKMIAIFFLLAILFLIFSILFTDLFKDAYDNGITEQDYFSRIDISLFTLFQIMTLDGWAEICKELMQEHPWAWAPFVCFVVVSSFFFLNLVIAVVCDAVTSVHQETVVKYIRDDISAATSVREALKVEDRLEELRGSVQLMMQAQITVLEGLQYQQRQTNAGDANREENERVAYEENLRQNTESLKSELDETIQRKKESKTPSEMTPIAANRSSPLNATAEDDISEISGPRFLPKDSKTFSFPIGPASAQFWQGIGLTDEQIIRVIDRLQENDQLSSIGKAS